MEDLYAGERLEQGKTLTVYKASAGSGKTFTLALEYIKLLLQNPYSYEGILAVTFTNKATGEMKMRILSTLYALWKRQPAADSYMKALVSDLKLREDDIARNAEKALRLLLHNYHFFQVQTIDAFFNSVLRNLARELQLNANLRVGINNKEVVSEAVDELINSLADDKPLMRVIKGYMEERLEDDKAWNVIEQIKSFGRTIFQELYKKNRRKMETAFANKDFFNRYKAAMQGIIRETAPKYEGKAKEILKIVEESGLTVQDFLYGATGPMGYFLKLSKGRFHDDEESLLGTRVKNAMEASSEWTKKTSKQRDLIINLAEKHLIPAILELEETRSKDAKLYRSAQATLRHLNDVRLLRRIEEEARNINNAAGQFMLSDTQSLLHEIIEEGDSPFIYEKIGARLNHVMIDEFQDTSTVQWANFKTLLKECMSRGQSNLIVGDVKQSIYRFRNGDWRLLNDIDKEFEASELDFQPKRTNWRSRRNVVEFNNIFFEIAAGIEVSSVEEYSKERAESLQKAYIDVRQDVPEKNQRNEGLVHIEMLPPSKNSSQKNANNGKTPVNTRGLDDMMKERTLQNILDLLALGIKQKDIAILLRNTKDIQTLAKHIESHSNVRIVSAEAFRLDASPAVRTVINAMKLLANPEDDVALAELKKDTAGTPIADAATTEETSIEDFLAAGFQENATLHELAEKLVRHFSLDKRNEGAYLTTLFDHIHKYATENSPLLEDFLEAWESDISSKTIESTDIDGVRILTIHKSKGLEFDHVILPYCNWKCDPPHSTIWAEPQEEPFAQLPMVPLDYYTVNSLKGTIYEADGVEEHIQNIVDNLNLLYVAMTRASRSLFIIGERNTKSFTRSKTICETIYHLPETICGEEVHIEGLEDEEQPLTVTFGVAPVPQEPASEEDTALDSTAGSNPFNTTPAPLTTRICSHPANAVVFRQSNDSRRFAEDAIDETDRARYIRLGTVMHQLFSTIHTLKDVEPTLRRMEFDGTLYDEELTREALMLSLKKKFSHEQAREWFAERWTVFNECSIITPQGEQRPDRVITDGQETVCIDFKFGKQKEEHKAQVKGYMELLRDMGMPNVKGFLWYVTFDKVTEC